MVILIVRDYNGDKLILEAVAGLFQDFGNLSWSYGGSERKRAEQYLKIA